MLICSPYKFFGPHLGLAFGKEELLASWRPYKVRPAADEPVGRRFELGTLQHELLAGFVAAVDYVDSLGWETITRYERELGKRFLAGLPEDVRLHGLPTMADRVPTFCFDVPGLAPRETAERLARRDVAVWWGNYYAVETMKRLGLDPVEGAAGRDRALQHRGGGRPPADRAGGSCAVNAYDERASRDALTGLPVGTTGRGRPPGLRLTKWSALLEDPGVEERRQGPSPTSAPPA